MHFDGETYRSSLDQKRLTSQFEAVRALMLDGKWRTLIEISTAVSGTLPSLSARLRDLRKARFGGYVVERRRVEGSSGLFEYRVAHSGGRAA